MKKHVKIMPILFENFSFNCINEVLYKATFQH